MISAISPTLTLNKGVEMPALGFGVFQTPPAETVAAVEAATREGYRLIDTAAAYLNEREVGEGIRRSGIGRGEMFVETKVWISDYGYEAALHAFEKSARKLGGRSARPVASASRSALGLRPNPRRLPGAGEAPGRRQGARDRCEQLHARAPRAAAR